MEFVSFFLVPESRENNIAAGVHCREGEARRLIPDGRPGVTGQAIGQPKYDFNFLPNGEWLTFGRGHEAERIAFRRGLVEGNYAR